MEPVSVIVPTHNRAHLIVRAVTSVLAAVRSGDELIVVDDGSTDNTAEVLAPFGAQIRYCRTENRGAGAARNLGLRTARHPLIAFLDSDDEWMADGLELKRVVMNARPDVVFCFTDFANRDDTDNAINRRYLVHWHHDTRAWAEILGPGVPFSDLGELPAGHADFDVHFGDMYALLLERPYVAAWTALVRRAHAGSAFSFAEDLRTGEDWACFGRLARCGPAAFLNCETAWNHGHAGRRLTTDAGFIGFEDAHLQIAERIWGADADFLKANRDRYEQTIASIHLKRARWYLGRGQTSVARVELAAAGVAPRSLRLLTHVPGWLLELAGDARRFASDRWRLITR